MPLDRDRLRQNLDTIRELGFSLTCWTLELRAADRRVLELMVPSFARPARMRPTHATGRLGVPIGLIVGSTVSRTRLSELHPEPVALPTVQLVDRRPRATGSWVDERVELHSSSEGALRVRALLTRSGRAVVGRVARVVTLATRQGLRGVALETFMALAIYQLERTDLRPFFGLSRDGVDWRVREMLRQLEVRGIPQAMRLVSRFNESLVPPDVMLEVESCVLQEVGGGTLASDVTRRAC